MYDRSIVRAVVGRSRNRRLNAHETVCLEVMRPSADCQTTFVRRFKQIRKCLRKTAERSRNSCGRFTHATVGWLSSTFSVVVTQSAEYCTSMRVIALPNRLNITLTLLCIRMYNRSIVGQSSEGHVTVAWPSSTYIHVYIRTYFHVYIRTYGHRHVVPLAVSLVGVYASTVKPGIASFLALSAPPG